MNQSYSNQGNTVEISKGMKRIIIVVAVIILLIITLMSMAITIKAGEGGVLFKPFAGGVKTDKTYGEGLHIIAPWDKMVTYKVRQQEILETMKVLSSNGLNIDVELSAWIQPDREKLGFLHQEKGYEYIDEIVRPAIRSATRSVIGRYTPEEIYSTKRDAIQSEIYEESKKILQAQYVQLNNILVRDIVLPNTIKTAIENKLKQEQESLEYKFRIQKAEKEALRRKIDAEGKANANKILNESLTDKVLKDKGIEATIELSKSSNSKIIVIGNTKDGLPLILGDN